MDKNEIFWSIIDNENIDNDLTDINKISMNSKECGKNDLFVAIRGGNNYINEALEKGAYAVYDNAHADIKEEYKNKTFFMSTITRALGQNASRIRRLYLYNGNRRVYQRNFAEVSYKTYRQL